MFVGLLQKKQLGKRQLEAYIPHIPAAADGGDDGGGHDDGGGGHDDGGGDDDDFYKSSPPPPIHGVESLSLWMGLKVPSLQLPVLAGHHTPPEVLCPFNIPRALGTLCGEPMAKMTYVSLDPIHRTIKCRRPLNSEQ